MSVRQYKVGASLQDAEFDLGAIALGINVLRQDGTWPVRELLNVDVSSEGVVRRRSGYKLIEPLSKGAHSIYYDSGNLYYVTDSYICANKIPKIKVLSPTYYARHHDWTVASHIHGLVFFDKNGEVTHDTREFEFKLEPQLSAIEDSGLTFSGKFQVAVAIQNENGIESQAYYAGEIEIQKGQGIMLEGLPQKPEWYIVVYMTEPNGGVFRHAVTYPAFLPKQALNGFTLGRNCDTLDLKPMIGGDHIASHNARVYTAFKDILSYSEEFKPHLYNPVDNRIIFSGKIRLVTTNSGGSLDVADDRGIWRLDGREPSQFSQRLLDSAIVADHSAVYVDTDVYCVTNKGYMRLDANGAHPVHADRIALRHNLDGRSAYMINKGVRQVISLVRASKVYPESIALDFE